MQRGELQRGSGCDMKYSDGGGKIQLTPFFCRPGLLSCSTWLEGKKGLMVVIQEEKKRRNRNSGIRLNRQETEERNCGQRKK